MSSNLGKKAASGAVWDMAGTFLKQLLGIGITIILARLLSPSEFGVVAIALVFVSLTEVFIDVGFTQGIIQAKELKSLQLSSIFILNILASIFFVIVLLVIADPVASFYEIEDLSQVIRLLAVVPLISALGITHKAIFTREMRFKALSLRVTLSTLVGGLVGISAAYLGQGVFSLVWKQITSAIVATLALWFQAKWKPKRHFNFQEIKELVKFSQFVFFDRMLRQLFLKMNTLFIGKIFSAEILGFYSQAEMLTTTISEYGTRSLRKVLFPALSSIQDNPQRFEGAFAKSINVATSAITLLVGVFFFFAEDFVMLVLGPQWRPSIPLFQLLLVSALFTPVIAANSTAILSKGQSKIKFLMGLIQRVLILCPLAIGYFHGITALAASVIVARIAVASTFSVFTSRVIGSSFVKQWRTTLTSYIPFFMAIICFRLLFTELRPVLQASLFLISSAVYYILIDSELVKLAKSLVLNIRSR